MPVDRDSLRSLLLTQDQVRSVLNMKDVVKIVENTYREHGLGKVRNPPKIGIDLGQFSGGWPDYGSFVIPFSAYVDSADSVGVKVAGEFRKFRKQGADQGSDLTVLIDPRLGVFRAVMDGTLITNFRTGASAAVGSKFLSKAKPKIATVIGAGVIGRMTLSAFDALIPLSELRVFDLREEAARSCVEEMKNAVSQRVTRSATLQDAVQGADIVVACTTAKTPYIGKELVEPGQLLVMLSGNDLKEETLAAADKIVVDNIAQHLTSHGRLLKLAIDHGTITKEDILGEIGEVVSGKKKGRISDDELVIFITRGMGILDVAVASHVYRLAVEKGLGTWFNFVNYDPNNFV